MEADMYIRPQLEKRLQAKIHRAAKLENQSVRDWLTAVIENELRKIANGEA